MKFRDRVIDFQNSAERDFEKKKNISTFFRFVLAMVVFFSSTIIAAMTLPFRLLIKLFHKKGNNPEIQTGTNQNIDELLEKKGLILIDFWAEWCGPCVMMNPTIQEFANVSKNIQVVKINADLNMNALKKFNVRGLPHFLLFKDGHEISRRAGSMTLSDLNVFCFGKEAHS